MRYEVEPTVVGNDEYRVVHLISTATGVEDCLTPQPPPGQGWRLVTVAIVGTQFFQYWRRPVRGTGERAVHLAFVTANGTFAECRDFKGKSGKLLKTTTNKREVTCKACRRTRAFKGKRGAR